MVEPRRFKVVGIGEVLWDLLPAGKQLGGAPANFAYHACALGAEGRIITRVGRDALGHEILKRLVELGLPTGQTQVDPSAPTGTVTIALSPDGQPRFTIHPDVAWDRLVVQETAEQAVRKADAVCFGSLAQRCEPARSAIQALLAAASPTALRIFDVNLRQRFYSRPVIEASMELANVLKLNDSESPVLGRLLDLRGEPTEQIEQLAHRYGLHLVALTRGAQGALLYSAGKWSDEPGAPVKVKDTVGAGDSFTAALALGLLSGWTLDKLNRRANEVARYVCSREGATPPIPTTLRKRFECSFNS